MNLKLRINKICFITLMVLSLGMIMPGHVYSQSNENRPTMNHLAICVNDLKTSTAFYSNVLELQKIPHPFKDTVHTWFSIGPHQQLHVIQANCPQVVHDINIHLCFSVASLDAFMKHLDQLHVKYGNWAGDSKKTQLRPDGVSQIYFQDPDGYWIEVNNAR